MSTKRVYTFGNGKADGKSDMKNLLGGKGANLAEMNLIGVPVSPGFTITIKTALLALLFTFNFSLVTVTAQYTLTVDDVEFDATTGTITDYLAVFVNIVIPSSFNINEEKVSVTTIGNGAFYHKSLTSVTIPTSVTTIGNVAFHTNLLTSITIPNSVTILGLNAFRSNLLNSINIPNSVTYIGSGAFSNNYLTNVSIPSSVTRIGDYAFVNNALTSVSFDQNSNIRSIGENAFMSNAGISQITLPTNTNAGFSGYKDSAGNYYGEGDNISDLNLSYYAILPTHTLIFDDVEFSNGVIIDYFGGYVDVIIPAYFNVWGTDVIVTTIGDGAFIYNSLTSVTISNSVTTIGERAFEDNYLMSVIMPNSVITIGENAFISNNLTSITIPNSVTTIGDRAFKVNDLTSVIIPNSVTTIGDEVFAHNFLTSVTIPNSVTSIGGAAFNNNAIAQINGVESNGIVYARNSDGTEDNTIIVSYGGVTDEIDFIPNSVTTIGDYAFAVNFLTSVTIPSSVTTIGVRAFYVNALTSITIPNSVTAIGIFAFANNFSLTGITLPNPVIKEGYIFTEWKNGGGIVVTEIANYYTSYEAQFTPATAIKEVKENNIKSYPNPVNNKLTIEMAGTYNSLQIISLGGNVLKVVDCKGLSIVQVDMGHFAPGMYIVKLLGAEGVVSKKVLKQ